MVRDAESDLITWRFRSEDVVRVAMMRCPWVWISPPKCTSEFLKLQSYWGGGGVWGEGAGGGEIRL